MSRHVCPFMMRKMIYPWIILTLIGTAIIGQLSVQSKFSVAPEREMDLISDWDRRPYAIYSRDSLLALRHLPTLPPPPFLSDIPAELRRPTRRKRGRRGGIRNRLRRRYTKPPLPAIILSNLRSLNNKIDDLRTHARYCSEFREASLLCLTESWLQSNAPDSLFEINGFTLIRLDRDKNSGKCKGGGICVFLNDQWCRQFTVKDTICDSNVEMLCLTLRPFYLPREFGCVLLCVVYVPPSGKASIAAATIADHVYKLLQKHPDAPAIIAGDLNHCQLDAVLPGFYQVVKGETRKDRLLDKCYVNVKDAYGSKIRPPIANSDHNVVHLIPTYKSKLKRCNAVEREIRCWSPEACEDLRACFEITNWDVFHDQNSLDVTTSVTTDYINFCVQLVIPSKRIKIYPNNKRFVSKDIKEIINRKKAAFKSKDMIKCKQLEKVLKNKLREAKQVHRDQLENNFKEKNPKRLWDNMKKITGMSSPNKLIVTGNELMFANELNYFFCRFDSSSHLSDCENIINTINLSYSDRIPITVEEVRGTFQRNSTRKALGPDHSSALILKTFAWELAPVWQPIFQQSLDTHHIPLAWKTSHIKPIPKKKCPKEYNDYRPIALTSVIMKSLEKIIVQHLNRQMGGLQDPYQFAYKQGRSTEDAVVALTHIISKHLDKPNTYARALFIDFSSAFNTIQPNLLLSKMIKFQINPYIIYWYFSFLTNRVQLVKVNDTLSSPITTNVGVPQGCISSPRLFTLYTSDCTTNVPNQFLFKYSDDSTLVTLFTKTDDGSLYQNDVDWLIEWCDNNYLIINTGKTEEVIFGKPPLQLPKVKIHNSDIAQVPSYKYLGVMIDQNLTWTDHIDFTCKKIQQRIYISCAD
ncbi:hypothetical protein ACEWY4_000029 [Coilia grayii]|uniref:Reverse transcriptase domain-containing protein n=1 Tax=Coilia grayii TaxID=363190 RepID=A0ABD1KVY1_9TELE